MVSSPAVSPTNRSPRPHPLHSNQCHPERSKGSAFRLSPYRGLSVSASSSPEVRPFNFQLSTTCPERTEGSCLVRPPAPIAPFEQSLLCRRPLFLAVDCELSTINCHPLSPVPATLAADSQLTENSATLSPMPATLTSRVKDKSFICHSCKKHPGSHPSRQIFSFRSLATHRSQITKSFTIRTYEKRARNSRRIRPSKTQSLKPFRMNTYKKTGGGPLPGTLFSLPRYLITSLLPKLQRRLHHSNSPTMLNYPQGATRFRRKLSRPEGMPGPTCP